jgi:hypothetical protein
MNKKRLSVLAGSLAACVCLTLGILAMLPSRPGVTKENFDLIEKGMARAKVEGIFGRQGKWYLSIKGKNTMCWQAYDGSVVHVWFFNDCVAEMEWRDSNEPVIGPICRWLRFA